MRLEQTILRNLIYNEEYIRKVLPFLKDEYFSDLIERTIFKELSSFVSRYNTTPTIEAIGLAIRERRNLSDAEVEKSESYLQEIALSKGEESKIQWLIEKSEAFCQERAIYNADLKAVHDMS